MYITTDLALFGVVEYEPPERINLASSGGCLADFEGDLHGGLPKVS